MKIYALLFVGSSVLFCIIPSHTAIAAELNGCPKPRVVAEAMRALNLPATAWRALTASAIRTSWRGLLNQVDCPDRPTGTYVLASFGRIINDESLCSTSFVIEFNAKMHREWLNKVIVYYTASTFREARAAADLFYSVWHPGRNVEVEEDGGDEWKRAARRPGNARTVSRWSAHVGDCQTEMEIDREIHASSSGWTAKVSLAPDSVCEPQ